MTTWRGRAKLANAVVAAFFMLGIAIALLGIGLEFLSDATPGFNLPQLLLIASGLLLAVLATVLRRVDARRRAKAVFKRHFLAALVLTVVSVLALEFILVLINITPYFPVGIPEEYYSSQPWTHRDRAGCHYNYEIMKTACENGSATGRHCVINRQGFHDSQDFIFDEALEDKLRILMLGESFTFGMNAELGQSYVETLEAQLPNATIWNTGIAGTGTILSKQSFEVYAPIMRPHLTILGFFQNDFADNVTPFQGYLTDSQHDEQGLYEWKDFWGNVIMIDLATLLHYRQHGIDPPASGFEHAIGTTRLGSLFLRLIDIVAEQIVETAKESREVEVTREYLRDFRDGALALDFELLVLIIPTRQDLSALGTRYHDLLDLLHELQISYLETVDNLDATLDYEPPPEIHWNSAGHQKVGFAAERLCPSLRPQPHSKLLRKRGFSVTAPIKAKRPNTLWDAWYIWGVSRFVVGTKNQDLRKL